MTDPRRWNDARSGAPLELRAALRVARAVGPSDAQLDALTSRLSAQLERGRPQESEAPATEAAAVRAEVQRWIRRLYLTSTLTLALVIGTGLLMRGEPRATGRPTRRVLSAERLDERTEASEPSSPLPAELALGTVREQPASSQSALSAQRSTRSSRRPQASQLRRGNDTPESATSNVEDELALLFQARRLVSRDAQRALLLLREHAQRFPHGTFQQERAALFIEALVSCGNGAEATRRYEEFRRDHPHSAYEARLSLLLALAPDAGAMRAE